MKAFVEIIDLKVSDVVSTSTDDGYTCDTEGSEF